MGSYMYRGSRLPGPLAGPSRQSNGRPSLPSSSTSNLDSDVELDSRPSATGSSHTRGHQARSSRANPYTPGRNTLADQRIHELKHKNLSLDTRSLGFGVEDDLAYKQRREGKEAEIIARSIDHRPATVPQNQFYHTDSAQAGPGPSSAASSSTSAVRSSRGPLSKVARDLSIDDWSGPRRNHPAAMVTSTGTTMRTPARATPRARAGTRPKHQLPAAIEVVEIPDDPSPRTDKGKQAERRGSVTQSSTLGSTSKSGGGGFGKHKEPSLAKAERVGPTSGGSSRGRGRGASTGRSVSGSGSRSPTKRGGTDLPLRGSSPLKPIEVHPEEDDDEEEEAIERSNGGEVDETVENPDGDFRAERDEEGYEITGANTGKKGKGKVGPRQMAMVSSIQHAESSRKAVMKDKNGLTPGQMSHISSRGAATKASFHTPAIPSSRISYQADVEAAWIGDIQRMDIHEIRIRNDGLTFVGKVQSNHPLLCNLTLRNIAEASVCTDEHRPMAIVKLRFNNFQDDPRIRADLAALAFLEIDAGQLDGAELFLVLRENDEPAAQALHHFTLRRPNCVKLSLAEAEKWSKRIPEPYAHDSRARTRDQNAARRQQLQQHEAARKQRERVSETAQPRKRRESDLDSAQGQPARGRGSDGTGKGKGKAPAADDPNQRKLSFPPAGIQGKPDLSMQPRRVSSRLRGQDVKVYDESSESDAPVHQPRRTPPPPPPSDRNAPLFSFPMQGRAELSLTAGDKYRVESHDFLNDTLIEFGLKYVLSKLNEEVRSKIHMFNSFFYDRLSTKKFKGSDGDPWPGYDSVKKWTKNTNIFEKDFILIPINENFHWYLAIIYRPSGILRAPSASSSSTSTPSRRSARVNPPKPASSSSLSEAPEFPEASVAEVDSERDELEADDEAATATTPYLGQSGDRSMALSEGDDPLRMSDNGEQVQVSEDVEMRSVRGGVGRMSLDGKEFAVFDDEAGSDEGEPRPIHDPAWNLIHGGGTGQPAKLEGGPAECTPENEEGKKEATRQIVHGEDCWIMTFDSLGGAHKAVSTCLNRWLRYEARHRLSDFALAARDNDEEGDPVAAGRPMSEARYVEARVPQQGNWSDCGLYLIHYAKQMLERREEILSFIEKPAPRQGTTAHAPWEAVKQEVWRAGDTNNLRRDWVEIIDTLHILWISAQSNQASAGQNGEEGGDHSQASVVVAEEVGQGGQEMGTMPGAFPATEEQTAGTKEDSTAIMVMPGRDVEMASNEDELDDEEDGGEAAVDDAALPDEDDLRGAEITSPLRDRQFPSQQPRPMTPFRRLSTADAANDQAPIGDLRSPELDIQSQYTHHATRSTTAHPGFTPKFTQRDRAPSEYVQPSLSYSRLDASPETPLDSEGANSPRAWTTSNNMAAPVIAAATLNDGDGDGLAGPFDELSRSIPGHGAWTNGDSTFDPRAIDNAQDSDWGGGTSTSQNDSQPTSRHDPRGRRDVPGPSSSTTDLGGIRSMAAEMPPGSAFAGQSSLVRDGDEEDMVEPPQTRRSLAMAGMLRERVGDGFRGIVRGEGPATGDEAETVILTDDEEEEDDLESRNGPSEEDEERSQRQHSHPTTSAVATRSGTASVPSGRERSSEDEDNAELVQASSPPLTSTPRRAHIPTTYGGKRSAQRNRQSAPGGYTVAASVSPAQNDSSPVSKAASSLAGSKRHAKRAASASQQSQPDRHGYQGSVERDERAGGSGNKKRKKRHDRRLSERDERDERDESGDGLAALRKSGTRESTGGTKDAPIEVDED